MKRIQENEDVLRWLAEDAADPSARSGQIISVRAHRSTFDVPDDELVVTLVFTDRDDDDDLEVVVTRARWQAALKDALARAE